METETCSEHCQTFKMERFAKKQGGEFLELRYFDKHFIKKQEKRRIPGKQFGVFLLDTLKTTF